MISLIAESLHFLHLLSNKEIQCSLKLLPIPETCLEGQTCVRVYFWCKNMFCEGSLNPFNFNFVSAHFGFRFPVGAASRFPSTLKSLLAIGMKHHSLSPT